jgi:hypothetical protein
MLRSGVSAFWVVWGWNGGGGASHKATDNNPPPPPPHPRLHHTHTAGKPLTSPYTNLELRRDGQAALAPCERRRGLVEEYRSSTTAEWERRERRWLRGQGKDSGEGAMQLRRKRTCRCGGSSK